MSVGVLRGFSFVALYGPVLGWKMVGPRTGPYGQYAISDLAQSSTEQEVLDKDITKRLFMRILEGTMIWYKQSAP